jgi:predicted DsbA family dithiol-disulfide isomerase
MKFTIAILIVTAAITHIFPQSDQQNTDEIIVAEIVATVEETLITNIKLHEAASKQLDLLQKKRLSFEASQRKKKHQILEDQLYKMIDEELLNRESKARNISKEKLLKLEINKQVLPTTSEEVDKFYNENKTRIRSPKDQVGEKITRHLEQIKKQRAHRQFISRLKQKYKTTYLLGHFHEKVATQGHPFIGPPNAPITIIEFSDFQCPFCSRMVPTLKQIRENYKDQVRLVFRQFPLNSIHPQAQKAAEASLCAANQNKFWEMHNLMFEDKKLSLSDLKLKAASLKLDTIEFERCLDLNQFTEQVKRDILDGARAGVTATPTMFINGRPLTGAVHYKQIKKIIDEELQLTH